MELVDVLRPCLRKAKSAWSDLTRGRNPLEFEVASYYMFLRRLQIRSCCFVWLSIRALSHLTMMRMKRDTPYTKYIMIDADLDLDSS